MPIFEVERDGKVFEVEAPDMKAALSALAPSQPQATQQKPSLMDYARTNVVGAGLQGLYRGGQGLMQLGARALSPLGVDVGAVDEAVRAQNRGYQEAVERVASASSDPTATRAFAGTGEVMGAALNPAGMAGNLIKSAPGVLNAALRGGVSGAAFGASQPVLDPESNFAGEKAKQVGLGALTGAATGALTASPKAKAPSAKELRSQAAAAYKDAEAEGVVIQQGSFQRAVSEMDDAVQKGGIDQTLHPKASAIVDRLKAEAKTGDLTLEKAETLRRVASAGLDSRDKSERRLVHMVIDKLDDYVGSLKPSDLARDTSRVGINVGSTPKRNIVAGTGEDYRAPEGSIFEAVRKLGGIKVNDNAGYITREGGEVRHALKDVRSSGLINNKSGMTPDKMREALQQEGWFGRQAQQGSDIDDFYQALRQGREYLHPENARSTARGIWEQNEAQLDSLRMRAGEMGLRVDRSWGPEDIQAAIDERLAMMGDDIPIGAPVAAGGGGNAEAAVEALTRARDLYARSAKAATVERLVERAKNAVGANYTTAGYETALRQQFRALANNEAAMRRFTPDEKAAILKVVRGGPTENALRLLGKMAVRGPISAAPAVAGGMFTQEPMVGAAIAGVGELGRAGATQLGLRNVRLAEELMRRGSSPQPSVPGPSPNVPVGNLPSALLIETLLRPQRAQ